MRANITLNDRNPDQNPVVWHVFLCFAFPGNRRSPQEPPAQPPDDPAGPERFVIEYDPYPQPAWVPIHFISRFSSRRCDWLRWSPRTSRNSVLPIRPLRHRAGRCKIFGSTRCLVRLAVAASFAGRGFADHANRIFPKARETVRGRSQHNLPRYSGDSYVRQWIEFYCRRSLIVLSGTVDR